MTDHSEPPPSSARGPDGKLTMSSITGKLVLALIRGSDYAHAGESEAIELVFEHLPRSPQTQLLDVGCGIGGTAHYIEQREWGKVTGIDIDPDNIRTARQRHPAIDFLCTDAAELDSTVRGPFDVIYAFNAFFLFEDRPGALRAMREVADHDALLAIFDYVNRGETQPSTGNTGMRRALRLEEMHGLLTENGWMLEQTVPAHTNYLRWYEALVNRIESMREAIIRQSSPDFYGFVHERYQLTCEDLRAGRLGGATWYARAV